MEVTIGISAATFFVVLGAIWNFSGRFSVIESRVGDLWVKFTEDKKQARST